MQKPLLQPQQPRPVDLIHLGVSLYLLRVIRNDILLALDGGYRNGQVSHITREDVANWAVCNKRMPMQGVLHFHQVDKPMQITGQKQFPINDAQVQEGAMQIKRSGGLLISIALLFKPRERMTKSPAFNK